MTAVKAFEVQLRPARQAAERKYWKQEAADHLILRGIYGPEEQEEALEYAETLCYRSLDESGELLVGPKEAVNDDLAYVPS